MKRHLAHLNKMIITNSESKMAFTMILDRSTQLSLIKIILSVIVAFWWTCNIGPNVPLKIKNYEFKIKSKHQI